MPWPPSEDPSILLCLLLVSSILVFLRSVICPSGRRPPIFFLVFPLVLYYEISHQAYAFLLWGQGYWCSSFEQCSDVPYTKGQILFLLASSSSDYQSSPRHLWSFLNITFSTGWGCRSHVQPPTWRTRVSLFVSVVTFDLSGMEDLASSYATASMAVRVTWPSKPHHYVTVRIPSGNRICNIYYLSTTTMVTRTRLSITFIRTLPVLYSVLSCRICLVSLAVHLLHPCQRYATQLRSHVRVN